MKLHTLFNHQTQLIDMLQVISNPKFDRRCATLTFFHDINLGTTPFFSLFSNLQPEGVRLDLLLVV